MKAFWFCVIVIPIIAAYNLGKEKQKWLLKFLVGRGLPFDEELSTKHDLQTPMFTIAFLITQTIGLIASVQDQRDEYLIQTPSGSQITAGEERPLVANCVFYSVGALIIFGANMGIMRSTSYDGKKHLFDNATIKFTFWTMVCIILISSSTVVAAIIGLLPGQTERKSSVIFQIPKSRDIKSHEFDISIDDNRNGITIVSSFFVKKLTEKEYSLPLQFQLSDKFHERFYISTVHVFNDRSIDEDDMETVHPILGNEDKIKRRSVKLEFLTPKENKVYYLKLYLRPRTNRVDIAKSVTSLRKIDAKNNRFVVFSLFNPNEKNTKE